MTKRSWISRARRTVLIDVPNTGAPLEQLVNLTSAALRALPIPLTRLIGLGIDVRSAGIRDLRFGAITDDDWLEQDPLHSGHRYCTMSPDSGERHTSSSPVASQPTLPTR